jgi:hypothetical protein
LLRDWSTTALPWPIYNLGLYVFRFLFWFQNFVMPASLALVNLSFTGFCLSEVIRTLAALDVAEALSRGPMTADELAKELGASCRPFLPGEPVALQEKCSNPSADHLFQANLFALQE